MRFFIANTSGRHESLASLMGRKPIFDRPMTYAERKRRSRELHRHRLGWPEDHPFNSEIKEWEASAFEPPRRKSAEIVPLTAELRQQKQP